MMSKKGKGAVFYSRPLYGVGGSEDTAKTRLKHQTLVQEYVELQEETDAMRTKLEAAKHRKLMLAAEVRFLCRRYKLLAETKSIHVTLQEEEKLLQPPKSLYQSKNNKKQLFPTKGKNHRSLPPRPEPKLKKRRYVREEVGTPSSSSIIDRNIKKIRGGKEKISVSNFNGRINISRENISWKAPVFDLNQNDTSLRKSITAFDLNQDTLSSGKEASLPTRAPIFDLNEISMGDEDFQNNVKAVKYEEAKKSLIRGINDEQQKDLKLSLCRNEGGGSSHVGKRKISWQDPVALRV